MKFKDKKERFYRELLEGLSEIIVLSVILIAGFEIKYLNRFYPNVFIGGEPVGGKNYGEVLGKFQKSQRQILEDGLTLVFFRNGASKEIKIPNFSFGLTADTVVEYYALGDVETAVRSAYLIGRNGSIFSRVFDQFSFFFFKISL